MIRLRLVIRDGEPRLYLDGIGRPGLYFWFDGMDARVRWSSRANDCPYDFRTTRHYMEVTADADAAHAAADALGVDLVAKGAWKRLMALASDVPPPRGNAGPMGDAPGSAPAATRRQGSPAVDRREKR